MSLCEEIGQVLPRMLMTGKEEGDLLSSFTESIPVVKVPFRPSSLTVASIFMVVSSIWMISPCAACRDQFLVRRMGGLGVLFDDVPLGGGGKGDTEGFLQCFEPVEGNTHPVLQEGYHGACGGIVLLFPSGTSR